MNFDRTLLKALLEPEYSRIEFWQQQQKESGFSEIVFWKKLNNSLDFYFDKINNEIERRNEMFLKAGIEPQYSNFGLSLFAETNGELKADFPLDNSVLIELRNKLLDWAESIKPFIYYYDFKQPNAPIQNTSLLKHYEFLFELNCLDFRTKLKELKPEQVFEFLDFHLRTFRRKHQDFKNWNELLAEWFRHTKKQMPATFTPQQKDNFLSWFENQAEVPKQKTSVEELPTTFEDLVHGEYSIQPFIDILKEVEPPLIDANCNFIGKPKGAICVWIDEMQRQAIIKHCSDRKQLAMLISQKIKNFSINDRMFDNYHTTAERNYRDDFKVLISKNKTLPKK